MLNLYVLRQYMKLNFSSERVVFAGKRLKLIAKHHIPLGVMQIFCAPEGKNKICTWNKDLLDTIGGHTRTAYVEHETFLKYLLLPALQQTQSPKLIITIARDVIVPSSFGITFENFLVPDLAEKISHLHSTGIPDKLKKEKDDFDQSDSRKSLHMTDDSKLFSWWNCYNGRRACDHSERKFDEKEFRKTYLQKKKDLKTKRRSIYGVGKQVSEQANKFSPVKLGGNISSLFALTSILFLFSVLCFCFEVLTYDAIPSLVKIHKRAKILFDSFLSTIQIGFDRIVQFDKWPYPCIYFQRHQNDNDGRVTTNNLKFAVNIFVCTYALPKRLRKFKFVR